MSSALLVAYFQQLPEQRPADKNKEGPWQELEQEGAACRWHRGALRSRACWRVFRRVEATHPTGFACTSDSGKK